MPLRLAAERMAGRRVLVVGDPILDTFITGSVDRLCSEGPVPVVVKSGEEDIPGGAANVAANIRSLGGIGVLAGLVGRDQAAERLRAALADCGLDREHIRLIEDPGRHTPHKSRVLAAGQLLARFDQEPAGPISPEAARQMAVAIEDEMRDCEVVVVSDYGCGSLDPVVLDSLVRARARRACPLLIDAKDLARHALLQPTLVTPNLGEGRRLTGRGGTPLEVADRVRRRAGAQWALVTMGGEGAALASASGERSILPAWPVQAVNEVGAGDSLIAACALALAAGASVDDAARVGMAAAAVAVAKPGTAVVEPHELAQRLRMVVSGDERRDALTAQRLAELLEPDRRQGRRVIFTNGVFDLLHAGHVGFLKHARELGDVLVVGVNSDASARGLKGRGRPINGERERLAVVAGVAGVDHALLFDGLTAETIIRVLRPNVFVKGGGRDLDDIAEASIAREVGAEVVVLPLVAGFSTSGLIGRIREETVEIRHAAG
jgi:D-beta-D-heptose 7-phosphate kinase/D-beta-D-heptose 1-phosphate adenosyltransferase